MSRFRDFFNRLRRKIASPIVGQQIALYLPSDDISAAKRDNLNVSDAVLAAYTRYWFAVIRRVSRKLAAEDKLPLTVYNTMHGHLALVRAAHEANADTYRLDQSCFLHGQPIGNWRVTVERLPDDHEFGENGVSETHDDNGTLVAVRATFDLPGGGD